MDQNWNLQFTDLLRNTQPSYWGNWTLDGRVAPGAVGTIDPSTGAFTYLTNLPNPNITATSTVPNDWKIQSSSVHESQTNVTFDGSVIDPETGEKITAGLKVTFSFSEQGSISSSFTLINQQGLQDFSDQIIANLAWLKQQAQSVNMLDNDQISQGFGVITNVLYASCGLNLGSLTDSSTFSIEGSVSGANAMAGNSDIGAKGSYATTNESSAFESHLWPSEANQIAGAPTPIAFVFASFLGDEVMPGWVNNVSEIEITLANNHGGTYIATAKATYEINAKSSSTSSTVSGGLTKVMNPIPPQATNLELDFSFEASGEHRHFSWPSPLAQFPTGQIVMDIRGVWPNGPTVTERATGEQG